MTNKKDLQQQVETLAKELLKRFDGRPLAFGMAVCPDHFTDETPPFHLHILEHCMNSQRAAIAAPRGFSKSTIVSFLYVLYCIVFRKKKHIVIIQNTLSKATGTLNSIKHELKYNSFLTMFGITFIKDAQDETIFAHADGHQIRVLCKGHEQMGSVRGEKFVAQRPDLIVIDDLEDDEMVKNPIRRQELQNVFDDAIEPAADFKTGQIIFVGTILHDDCLMSKVVNRDLYRDYSKVKYKALDDKREASLWPQRYPLERLLEIEAANPSKFAKEYQNDPVSGRNTYFNKEDFRYWKPVDGRAVLYGAEDNVLANYDLKDCAVYIGSDLAWEEKRTADFSVILPAIVTPGYEVLLDEYICDKGIKPDKLMEYLFELDTKYLKMTGRKPIFGFEKAKIEKFLRWLLKDEMRKRNHYLIMRDVKWDGDKITRIANALQPRYSAHTIFHRRNYGQYEEQLLRVPEGTHDDLPDAAQIAVKLVKKVSLKKSPPPEDSEFDKILKWHRSGRERRPHVFGQPPNRPEVPHKKSLW